MNIWSKVLLGFVIVATLPFLYLAMRALKTHDEWRSLYEKAVVDLEQVETENLLLVDSQDEVALANLTDAMRGGDPAPGIKQLKIELHDKITGRGGVWYDRQPLAIDPATAKARLSMGGEPNTLKIDVGATLVIFESRPAEGNAENASPGQYLGQFKVSAVDPATNEIEVEPIVKLSERERQRIAQSQGAWNVHEVMPADRHDVFEGMDEAALAELLPDPLVSPEARREYLRDGETAAADDAAENVADGKYVRPLVDYTIAFQEIYRQRSLLTERIAAAEKDLEYLAGATADAERQIAFRREEIAALRVELATSEKERDLAQAHLTEVSARRASVENAVKLALVENKDLAAQWRTMQLRAAERVNAAVGTEQTSAVLVD